MLWRNTKEYVFSENSCSKNFINFQEKHPGEIAFLNKVTGYLTVTGSVLLQNLWNFQNRFHKKHPWMQASAISCCWKIFRPNIFLKKISHLIWYSMACAPRIKFITDVWRPFAMFILICTWFVQFTSLRDFFIWENSYAMSIVFITHPVHFSNQEVLRRQAAHGSSSESEWSWNDGKKKQLKLNFFLMYFVRNNEETHLSFKNSEK